MAGEASTESTHGNKSIKQEQRTRTCELLQFLTYRVVIRHMMAMPHNDPCSLRHIPSGAKIISKHFYLNVRKSNFAQQHCKRTVDNELSDPECWGYVRSAVTVRRWGANPPTSFPGAYRNDADYYPHVFGGGGDFDEGADQSRKLNQ